MGLSTWLGKFVGGTAGTLAKDVAEVVDKFVETPDEKAAALIIKAKMAQEPAKWQAEINKIQVAHRTMFVAGARPAIMWTCALGLFFSFIANPILQWWTGNPGPQLPVDIMMELTVGMLGLSGLRTLEKLSGISK